jgi:hypothetical protein
MCLWATISRALSVSSCAFFCPAILKTRCSKGSLCVCSGYGWSLFALVVSLSACPIFACFLCPGSGAASCILPRLAHTHTHPEALLSTTACSRKSSNANVLVQLSYEPQLQARPSASLPSACSSRWPGAASPVSSAQITRASSSQTTCATTLACAV